jgi:hypothetical protein
MMLPQQHRPAIQEGNKIQIKSQTRHRQPKNANNSQRRAATGEARRMQRRAVPEKLFDGILPAGALTPMRCIPPSRRKNPWRRDDGDVTGDETSGQV